MAIDMPWSVTMIIISPVGSGGVAKDGMKGKDGIACHG